MLRCATYGGHVYTTPRSYLNLRSYLLPPFRTFHNTLRLSTWPWLPLSLVFFLRLDLICVLTIYCEAYQRSLHTSGLNRV